MSEEKEHFSLDHRLNVLGVTSNSKCNMQLLDSTTPAPTNAASANDSSFAPDLIGQSRPLRESLELVERAAPTKCTILVRGETGTGKELVARAVHEASPRSNGPFVAVNCAAIPESLLEAELFGHTRGAFTGATASRAGRIPAADGGTLFLDEVGELPLAAQAKLLRVLQDNKYVPVGADREVSVDLRIVAATHRNLEQMVAEGTFREDLYYRLAVIQATLPPLRERGRDVLSLAFYFLRQSNRTLGTSVTSFGEGAAGRLLDHAWPGNVRELANVVERAVLLRQNGMIAPEDLMFVGQATQTTAGRTERQNLNLKDALGRLESDYIESALEQTGGNRTEAAALLGLNRTTLVEKLRRLQCA
jgi:transcriptional regulator with PAS, ATPase and Fis domain